MSAAVLKFKDLGINEVVKDLELTELGNHIAATLREMTGKKRKGVDGKPFLNASVSISRNAYVSESGESFHSSRKSPRLTPSSRILALALQSGLETPPPESTAAGTDGHPILRYSIFVNTSIANHGLFSHPCYSLMPTLAQEYSDSQGPQDENASSHMVDDLVVPWDPFISC